MRFRIRALTVGLGLACAAITGPAHCQNPAIGPALSARKLKMGFADPVTIDLKAGGSIATDKAGVKAFVTSEPNFVVDYEADPTGRRVLTIFADSRADTTLLIQLPNGCHVANDNGPGEDVNPLLMFEKPATGRYSIWVGTVGKESADARLVITETKWAWQGQFDPTKRGKTDNVRGTPYQEFDVVFMKNKTYEIKMRADIRMFFPCIRLEDATGRQIKSASSRDKADDGFAEGFTKAQLSYFCKETGKFRIIATNYAGASGAFVLSVREDGPDIHSAENEYRDVVFSERLERTDPKDSVLRKSPCKFFLFKFKPDTAYEIRLRTPMRTPASRSNKAKFDAVLRLEDDSGQELLFNDDQPYGPDEDGILSVGRNTDSQMTFACKSNRTFRIIATSLNAYYSNTAANPDVGCGPFTLRVSKVIKDFSTDHVKRFIKDEMETACTGHVKKFIKDETETAYVYKAASEEFYTPKGYLSVFFDRENKKIAFYDEYRAPAEETDKEGWARATANKWQPNGRMSMAVPTPDGAVRFRGIINFANGITFERLRAAYDQIKSEQEDFNTLIDRLDHPLPEPKQVVVLSGGYFKVHGQFTRDDPKDPIKTDAACHVYAVNLTAGKKYQIDMTSNTIDSYLRIHNEAGKILDSDDDGSGDFDSKIDFVCPADGTYLIVATSVRPGIFLRRLVELTPTGDYTLTIRQK